jgi:hypothetical protein
MAELKATLTFDMDAGVEAFKALAEDNARLRALLKQAEHVGPFDEASCPWCGLEPGRRRLEPVASAGQLPIGTDRLGRLMCWVDLDRHAANCPAFTPTGEVK